MPSWRFAQKNKKMVWTLGSIESWIECKMVWWHSVVWIWEGIEHFNFDSCIGAVWLALMLLWFIQTGASGTMWFLEAYRAVSWLNYAAEALKDKQFQSSSNITSFSGWDARAHTHTKKMVLKFQSYFPPRWVWACFTKRWSNFASLIPWKSGHMTHLNGLLAVICPHKRHGHPCSLADHFIWVYIYIYVCFFKVFIYVYMYALLFFCFIFIYFLIHLFIYFSCFFVD